MRVAPAVSRKKREVVTTGPTGAIRLSPRNGFNGFLRALLGEPGFLATLADGIIFHRLDPSIGGPGPHDFAVREKLRSSHAALASIASRPA